MAVMKINFLSKELALQVNVNAIIPSYSFADTITGRSEVYKKGMKFQTLWLLHGSTGDQDDYINFSNIVRYADEHKIAVIMPPALHTGFLDIVDGARGFSFITGELMDMCYAMLPLSRKREDNFIAGLSMGSSGAIRAAMVHPEKYAAALVMSGTCGFTKSLNTPAMKEFRERQQKNGETNSGFIGEVEGDLRNINAYAERNLREGRPLPKLFMTWGADDMLILDSARESSEWYRSIGYDVFSEEVPGYRHEWDFWDLTLRKAIKEWLPIRHSAIYPGEE